MNYNPEERVTAKEALNHPWIKIYETPDNSYAELPIILKSLEAFRTQMTLQKAVLSYIASQELSNSEEGDMRNAFSLLDTSKNGVISKEELIQSYISIGLNPKMANFKTNRVMKRIDLNRNGVIDYNEFLMANLIRKNALTNKRLKMTFEFLDSVIFRMTLNRIKMDI